MAEQSKALIEEARELITELREDRTSAFCKAVTHKVVTAKTENILRALCNELDQQVSQNEVQAENLRHLQELGRVQKEAIEAAIKYVQVDPVLDDDGLATLAQLKAAITPKGEPQ